MAPRATLFDLDGTLIDSIALILSSFHHTRKVHFGDTLDDADYIAHLGTTLFEHFALWDDDPGAVKAMVATYREHNLAAHDRMVRAYDGAVEMVQRCIDEGQLVAIVTSKLRHAALRGLEVGGFGGAFEIHVCADDVTRGKPDPEPVLLACDRLGVAPGDCLFVGDSPHDMKAGRAAGARTAAALWGPFDRAVLLAEEPDLVLERPSDLATALPGSG